jgi:acetyl esterase/lipase
MPKEILYGTQDPSRQAYDIYLPESVNADLPVLFFVHGGAWISNHKSDFEFLGQEFSKRGFVTVITTYRLVKKPNSSVVYPDFTDDVLLSLQHAVECLKTDVLGGNDPKIVMIGHSAGVHLIGTALKMNPNVHKYINLVIYVEGIFDLVRFLEYYPAYGDWFIHHAFPNRTQWPVPITENAPKLRYVIMHSKDDELISQDYAEEFAKQFDVIEFVQLKGGHDEVLKSTLLFEEVARLACM